MSLRASFAAAGTSFAILACGAPSPKEPMAPTSPRTDDLSEVTVSQSPPAESSADPILSAMGAADRSADDRSLDAGRKPDRILSFFGVAPGQRVAELGAGGGYTAELLARVVGPTGTVFGQNNRFILERFAEKPWSERLAKPVMKNVVRVDREFDDPLPPEAKNLDVVLCILFYHDTVWMKTDRAAMNRAIYAALEPGGVFGIVDHSAAEGAGARDAQTLHRIEKRLVVEEVEAAGFRLAKESDALASPDDSRDWNASPRAAGEKRGTSDRFALRFEKP